MGVGVWVWGVGCVCGCGCVWVHVECVWGVKCECVCGCVGFLGVVGCLCAMRTACASARSSRPSRRKWATSHNMSPPPRAKSGVFAYKYDTNNTVQRHIVWQALRAVELLALF